MGSTPRSNRRSRTIAGTAGLAFLLAAWELASLAMGKALILPSPLLRSADGARALPYAPPSSPPSSLPSLRGLAAFALSSALGIAAGLASGLRPSFGAALAPLLTAIRATPVLALALIALLWFPSGFVPIFTAFLMAFPVMTTSAAEGAKAADPRLLEMSRLFRVPRRKVLRELRLPAAAPHLIAGAKSALGLSWKVVVAGEILSQPDSALGTGMQGARMLLETASVFAWALAAVALCALTEWAFALAARKVTAYGL